MYAEMRKMYAEIEKMYTFLFFGSAIRAVFCFLVSILVTGGDALCCVTIAYRGTTESVCQVAIISNRKKDKENTEHLLLRKLRGVDEQLCLFDLVELHKGINQHAHLRRFVQRLIDRLILGV